MIQRNNDKEPEKVKTSSIYRIGLGIVIIALAFTYTCAVITGYVPEGSRIDMVTLAVIAFSVICSFLLITPRAFDRIKMFEMRGFKLEMLEKVKEKQAEQESRLEDIALVLPLLLPKAERRHLVNLADGKTTEYDGSHSARSELRSLRSAGLIKSLPSKHIAQLENSKKIDIAMLVELTTLGKRWVKRIREIEQAEADDNA